MKRVGINTNRKLLSLVNALFVVLLGVFIFRMHKGVDFYDETSYFTNLYQLYKGGIPFTTSYSQSILTHVLLVPFIYIYKFINGSFDGVILAMRTCYLVLNIIIYLFAVRETKIIFGACSYYIFAPVIFYSSYSIVSLSYNSISNSLNILFMVMFAVCLLRKSAKSSLLSGAFLALAIIAYPTLIIYLVITIILYIIYCYKYCCRDYHLFLWFLLGGVIIMLLFSIALIIYSGGFWNVIDGIMTMMKSPYFSLQENVTLYSSLFIYLQKFKKVSAAIGIITVCVLLAMINKRSRNWIHTAMAKYECHILWIISFLFLFIIYLRPASFYLIYYIFIAFYALYLVIKNCANNIAISNNSKFIISSCLLLGFLFLIIRLFSTSNKNVFAQFVYVTPFALILLTILFVKYRNTIYVAISSLCICSIMTYSYFLYVNDISIQGTNANNQNILVTDGIYKGIYVDESKYQKINFFANSIKEVDFSEKKVMVIDTFPYIYSLTDGLPYAPETYSTFFGVYDNTNEYQYMYKYFEKNGSIPDYIIIANERDYTAYPFNDESISFNDFLNSNYIILESESLDSNDNIMILSKIDK